MKKEELKANGNCNVMYMDVADAFFYPAEYREIPDRLDPARAVCDGCPVATECSVVALLDPDEQIRAGYAPWETEERIVRIQEQIGAQAVALTRAAQ